MTALRSTDLARAEARLCYVKNLCINPTIDICILTNVYKDINTGLYINIYIYIKICVP